VSRSPWITVTRVTRHTERTVRSSADANVYHLSCFQDGNTWRWELRDDDGWLGAPGQAIALEQVQAEADAAIRDDLDFGDTPW